MTVLDFFCAIGGFIVGYVGVSLFWAWIEGDFNCSNVLGEHDWWW